jgi:predicted secreted hydrolase
MNIRWLFALVLIFSGCKEGFQSVSKGREFSFPRDHGSHEEFRLEWWYFTGHLFLDDKAPFKDDADYGFQLTFFRSADEPRKSSLMAHGALSDIKNNKFSHEKRFALYGSKLGAVSDHTLDVSLQSWRANLMDGRINLKWTVRDCGIELRSLNPLSPRLNGISGFSQKAREPKYASYYYSVPRIEFEGIVNCGTPQKVKGLGWMDHEFMTELLAPGKIGWDWYSLMGENGESLMFFRVRGEEDNYYYGSHFLTDGTVKQLSNIEFVTISNLKSDSSKAVYPRRVRIKSDNIQLEVTPLLDDQEIPSSSDGISPAYWEGAIKADGWIGYAEYTGYDRALSALP